MTANTASAFRRAGKKTLIPALLFALSIVLTVFVTWQTAQSCLDGDASSELVLAQHLNETGRILSSDWYYSTELRVLNTQLVFAPLFSLFSDWTMVRFTGALILQATLVLSFFYLCRQAKLSWGARFLGGALLLLPVSVTYGRNVLYQTFYAPHLTIGFLIVALFLSALRHACTKRSLSSLVRLALLCMLSFLSGLGGVRQVIITHCPLALSLLLLLCHDAKDQPILHAVKAHSASLLLLCAAALFFLAGYTVNLKYLASRFAFSDYHNLILRMANEDRLSDILFSILHPLGFREGIRALSPAGILSASSVFTFLYCMCSSFASLRSSGSAFEKRLLSVFPLFAVSVILCVFVFVEFSGIYQLYMIPAIVWIVPLLAVQYDAMPQQLSRLRFGHAAMLLCTLFLAGNGLINAAYFSTNGRLFPQKYDGQWHTEIDTVKKLEKPVAFLEENGYDLGYAEFWYANPVTEMTDGAISMVNVLINQYGRPLIEHNWLMLRQTPYTQTDKAFLLLSAYHDRAYATMPYAYKGERVYDDGEFVIYGFDDPAVISEYTSWEYVLPQ